jgi:predicted nucleic-acid-binding Zn-ribbon protein
MTRKLVHCPKCGKNSFVNLNVKEETRNLKKRDFDKILRAVSSVPPPKN